jgi:hypothetical protein
LLALSHWLVGRRYLSAHAKEALLEQLLHRDAKEVIGELQPA